MNVARVLVGTIQRVGERVHVQAQLVNATDGSQYASALLTHDPLVVEFKVVLWLDSLRKHPRFMAMLRRLE